MRKTANSFNKTKRSTAISSSESIRSMQIFSTAADPNDDDNHVSELISNNDQVIAGTPLSILRGKKKGRQPLFALNTGTGESV